MSVLQTPDEAAVASEGLTTYSSINTLRRAWKASLPASASYPAEGRSSHSGKSGRSHRSMHEAWTLALLHPTYVLDYAEVDTTRSSLIVRFRPSRSSAPTSRCPPSGCPSWQQEQLVLLGLEGPRPVW